MIRIITKKSALEQAIAKKDFDKRIESLEDTIIKHIAKVILHKNSVDQNKWRKEIATKFAYLNRAVGKNNKKFSRSDYAQVFESSFDDFEYFIESINTINMDLNQEEGYPLADISTIDWEDTYHKFKQLEEEIISIFMDKHKVNYTITQFREVIDKYL